MTSCQSLKIPAVGGKIMEPDAIWLLLLNTNDLLKTIGYYEMGRFRNKSVSTVSDI
jgi:hypothetical protein